MVTNGDDSHAARAIDEGCSRRFLGISVIVGTRRRWHRERSTRRRWRCERLLRGYIVELFGLRSRSELLRPVCHRSFIFDLG